MSDQNLENKVAPHLFTQNDADLPPQTEPEPQLTPQELKKKKLQKISRYAKMIIFLCILIGLIIFIIIRSDLVAEWMQSFLQWVQDSGFLGMFVFVLVYIVATICFIPGLILTLGAGFVFSTVYGFWLGLFIGSVVVFIGASIGATLAMIMGRYVFRNSLKEKVQKYPKFLAIEEAIDEQGFKLTALLRLSPLIPFNAFNYFMGITSVKLKDYMLACVGMLPGTVAYVYLGSALGSISDAADGNVEGGFVELGFFIGGSILAFIAVVYVSIVAKRKINVLLEKNKEKEASKDESQRFRDNLDNKEEDNYTNRNIQTAFQSK